MKWAILLYGLGISGGANVIFEHALYAYNQGVEVTFITKKKQDWTVASWHVGTKKFLYKTIDEARNNQYDVVIATEWRSAFDAYQIKAYKYIYFVQSIESRFFINRESLLAYVADTSYEMDYLYITEATWIQEYLQESYGKTSALIRNGINKDWFTREGSAIEKRTSDKIRFLVEGSVSNWLKNVPKTIELCRKGGAEEIWLVTPDTIETYPDVDKVFSKVPMDKMPEIYRSCDVLVKLSLVEGMFGPPLEMFHCGGTVITYDIEGAEEYIKNEYNAVIVHKNDEHAVVEAIRSLISDRNKLEQLKVNALKTASNWIGWDVSSKAFFRCVENFPKTDSISYKNIFQKGHAGAVAYRQVEELLGMDSSVNRIAYAVECIQKHHYKLMIFGAGYFCKSSIIQFAKYDIEIHGILVSDKKVNPKTVMGHKVVGIDEVSEGIDDYLIYVSTEKYMNEIVPMLKNRGFNNIV